MTYDRAAIATWLQTSLTLWHIAIPWLAAVLSKRSGRSAVYCVQLVDDALAGTLSTEQMKRHIPELADAVAVVIARRL